MDWWWFLRFGDEVWRVWDGTELRRGGGLGADVGVCEVGGFGGSVWVLRGRGGVREGWGLGIVTWGLAVRTDGWVGVDGGAWGGGT